MKRLIKVTENFIVYDYALPNNVKGLYCKISGKKLISVNLNLTRLEKENIIFELKSFALKNKESNLYLI